MARNSNDRPTDDPEIVVRKSLALTVELRETDEGRIVWEDGVLLIETNGASVTFVGAGAFDELREALDKIWYEIPDDDG